VFRGIRYEGVFGGVIEKVGCSDILVLVVVDDR